MISPKKEVKLDFEIKQKEELKRAFDLLDEKGIGIIDCQDIVIVARALDLHIKSSNLSKLIQRYDPQNTGKFN